MITACKFCHFALYDKNTQIGCRLGKLDKFREQGYDIVEAYDEEKEFYLVKAFCPFFRTDEWARSKIDPFKSVADETKINYHVIVKYNPLNFETIKHYMVNQRLKPNTFSILNMTGTSLDSAKFYLPFNYWRIMNIAEDISVYQALDSVVSLVDDPVYVFIDELSDTPIKDIGEKLDKVIVQDLQPFLAIQHDNNYVCSKAVHNEFGGNVGSHLMDKLQSKGFYSQILIWT